MPQHLVGIWPSISSLVQNIETFEEPSIRALLDFAIHWNSYGGICCPLYNCRIYCKLTSICGVCVKHSNFVVSWAFPTALTTSQSWSNTGKNFWQWLPVHSSSIPQLRPEYFIWLIERFSRFQKGSIESKYLLDTKSLVNQNNQQHNRSLSSIPWADFDCCQDERFWAWRQRTSPGTDLGQLHWRKSCIAGRCSGTDTNDSLRGNVRAVWWVNEHIQAQVQQLLVADVCDVGSTNNLQGADGPVVRALLSSMTGQKIQLF